MSSRLSVLLFACLVLASCGTPGPTPEQRAGIEAPARSLEAAGQWREAALAWQQAADANPGDIGAGYRLNAADALLREGDGLGAAAVARKLPERLPDRLALRRALILADASLLTNDPIDALSRVGPGVTAADPVLLARYRRIRADALELTGDTLGAVRERSLRDPLLTTPEDIYRNRLKVWELLAQVPDDVLGAQQPVPPEAHSGWVQLAIIARRHPFDADALDVALAEWTSLYPGHPAGEQIIPELMEAVRADATPPTKVALLLPLSGPFANAAAAVRDGFMAAWFADAANADRPEVAVHDTTSGDPALVYDAAITDGAQFVIGPLARDAVNAVLLGADLSVTTLTLNYPSVDDATLAAGKAEAPAEGALPGSQTPGAIDASQVPTRNVQQGQMPPTPAESVEPPSPAVKDFSRVFHFALSPEDEAARAAEHAFERGARQAGVLAPEGAWGTRIAEAFARRFEALGGVVPVMSYFPEEATGLSEAVEDMLNITDSKQRAKSLRGLLARNIKHEPEPRSDLDAIFLAAFPQTARQLRPLLQFHRAEKLPIVATSHIYSGRPDPGLDQDIEGVVFGDMPWLLDPDTYTLPGQAARIWPESGGPAGRLYAFGADAYTLVAQLRELRASATANHPGLTGTLSLDDNRRVRRELEWASIREGVPVRVEADTETTTAWGIAYR